MDLHDISDSGDSRRNDSEQAVESPYRSQMEGYLHKLEQRPIVGQMRKKYWFVLPQDSPVLYWYKSPNEFNCAGRILLTGAAFTFNPRERGIFEIHVDNKCYVLEASNNKVRWEWLSSLQHNRKQYYQRSLTEEEEERADKSGSEICFKNGVTSVKISVHQEDETIGEKPTKSGQQPIEIEPRSVFYLSEEGELHPGSLEVPPPMHSMHASIDNMIARVADETQQQLEQMPAKKFLKGARNSLRRISQSSHGNQPIPVHPPPKENCDRCQELVQSLDVLRNRCYELTDDLVVYQDLVSSLKRSVISAHSQRDALKRYYVDSTTDAAKVDFILERESTLAKNQFIISELRRDIESLKEENRWLEDKNSSLNITVEAYQESLRTKEELVRKYADADLQQGVSSVPTTSSIPINVRNNYNGGASPIQSKNLLKASHQLSLAVSAEATEALLVDFGTPTDVAAKNLFTETAVNDLNEMKDLVDGYRNQNKFLNNEVLELQRIVQSLEDRERKLIRQNFNIEAVYYQLKSRYIMLLNHFRPSDQPKRVVESSLIQQLIDEVSRPHSPMRAHNANSLALDTVKSPSALATFVSCPQNIAIAAYGDSSSGILRHDDSETDSLGFYLSSPRSRKAAAIFRAQFQEKASSDEESAQGSEEGEAENEIGNDEQKLAAEPQCCHLSKSFSERKPFLSTATQTSHLAEKIARDEPAKMATSSSSAPSTAFPPPAQSSSVDQNDDWLLRMAADLQRRSDDIWTSIELGNNEENQNPSKEVVEWLQRWDAFLVNHVLQPLSPNPQLKALVRCGIPHTYRSRVWGQLVNFLVGSTQSETGKGYYECLLRKALRVQELQQGQTPATEEDQALKQIDLDLIRTLPNNKLFETEQSLKVGSLRNILYAFRFHNRAVEYCQGLNRLAAIGLLYLDETQAFWFLVACVEHLQPPNYYSSNLLGAVIDQRVLLDLVQDKLPALYGHLQRLEVDLSLFTLSWFLTIFVDVLSHNIYVKIFDVFLHEGNKVLFRFALAILKLAEPRIVECTSLSGVQNCLSNLLTLVTDFKTLAHVAFNCLNPFPAKSIEHRRQSYYAQYKNGKFK